MVFQKKLDIGFHGYQIPAMPRGSRSARGRRSVLRNVQEKQMCAFELLATVAGRLLVEGENSLKQSSANSGGTKSPSVNKEIVKQEQLDEAKPLKVEPCDQGSCDEGTLTCDFRSQRLSQKYSPPKECSQASSSVVKSDASEKTAYPKETLTDAEKVEDQKRSPCCAESYEPKVVGGIATPLKVVRERDGLFCSEDPMDLDAKPPALVSSDSSVEVPLYRSHIPQASIPKFRSGGMDLADRDDDENSSGCTQPSTITSKSSRHRHIGDRRIRKLSASKFWKIGPTLLNDGEFYNSDAEMKPMFRSRKMSYTRQRTQRSSFKRRKLIVRSSISTSGGEIGGKVLSKLLEKGIKGEANGSDANTRRENGTSPAITGSKSQFKSEDYKVKLRIKSFKVPELHIEMPENATIGSLKRTVLETVSAMLENGLRVGVILQGKKVRDDSKTLQQAGISHGDKLDSLGFTLEPNPSEAPPQLSSLEDPHFLQPCDVVEPLACLPALPASESRLADASPADFLGPPASPKENYAETNHNSVRSPADVSSSEKETPTSKALVPVPAASAQALAVVPLHRKSRRSELVQRRIRRPFSVAEVEALVQAVENLGTGRWRDVKIRAFDNAKHRTYVDLKDKWKTLVHTARISPQQRRGEPVPQEILDRVLAAHGYWSQQQAKLQDKPPPQLLPSPAKQPV